MNIVFYVIFSIVFLFVTGKRDANYSAYYKKYFKEKSLHWKVFWIQIVLSFQVLNIVPKTTEQLKTINELEKLNSDQVIRKKIRS